MDIPASITRDQSGAAAAEMALLVPLLVILMFGSFELGHYFWNEHKVVKAVRDGARFAGRQSFSTFVCTQGSTTTVSATTGKGLEIDNLVRFGKLNVVANVDQPIVRNWTNPVTIQVTCAPAATYSGIYNGMEGNVPVVQVAATTAYPSLFASLGFNSASLNLVAESQSAVMGI